MEKNMNNNEIILYLSNKYNKEFIVLTTYKQSWGLDTIYGVKSLNDQIIFTVIKDEFDQYTDNYQLSKSKEKLNHQIREILKLSSKDVSYTITYHNNNTIDVLMITLELADSNSINQILNHFLDNEMYYHIECICRSDDRSYHYLLSKDNGIIEFDRFRVDNAPDQRLNDTQLERLCNLVYLQSILDLRYIGNLKEIATYILENGYGIDEQNGKYPIFMSKEEWDIVLNDIINDSILGTLNITKYIDVNELSIPSPDVLIGHRVVSFTDLYDRCYVIYRGTASDEEWLDNGQGMLSSDTIQQKASIKFIYEVKEELNPKSIIVAGHSKGANKAQYVTLAIPDDCIEYCLSLDGQGFSKEFINKYNDNIKTRKDKIHLIAEQRDFVNCLGHYINDTTFYRGRRGDTREFRPYGDPIIYFHIPDALRNQSNQFGEKYDSGAIPSMINRLVLLLLDNDKYKDIRETTIKSIVSLMMSKSSISQDELAESIKNIILAVMDIVNHSDEFNNEILEIIYKETNTIIATIELGLNLRDFTSLDSANQNSLGQLIIKKLVSSLIKKPNYILYLGKFIKKVLWLIKKISSDVKADKRILRYLGDFILEVLDHIIPTINNKLLRKLVEKMRKLINNKLFVDSFAISTDDELDEMLNNWEEIVLQIENND